MSTATAGGSKLEIECAKPGCHWKGAPKDAPAHPCPTPPTAGTNGTVPIEDAVAIAERETLFAKLDNAGATYDRSTSTEGLRELVALTTGEDTEAVPAYDSDPKTKDELEAWLSAHGQYDGRGIPNDERTAELDARYAAFLEAARDDEPPLDDEPEALPIAAEADSSAAVDVLNMDDVPADLKAVAADALVERDGPGPSTDPRPWQTVVAEALEDQPGIKDYRWLVIWHPADENREAELIGRGKVKNEAVVIQEDIVARGQLTGDIKVEKTADVLAQAAEIEKKRELVDEPNKVVEADDPEEAEVAPPPATKPPAEGAKPALFDPSDYDREDLALPKVDGHPIDRIAVAFSGEVMLDRSNPDHVALFKRLKLGRKVELWIEAKGLGWTGKGATNKDGDLNVVVAKRSLTVETVRILGPEELGNAANEVAAQARDAQEAEDARERIPAE